MQRRKGFHIAASVISVMLACLHLYPKKSGAFPLSAITPSRRVALVTGANRGLGLATSQVLVEEGYHVIMTSRDEAQGRMAVTQVREAAAIDGGSVTYMKLDVTSPQAIKTAAEHVHQVAGGLHLLVNNAGICVRDAAAESFLTSLDVNTMGPFRLMQALMPQLIRTSNMDGGACVINVSSGDGELVYLHTDIAKDLSSLHTIQEWEAYMNGLRILPWSERVSEVAHLPWPAYSLSKAALNAGTRIWGASAAAKEGGVCIKAVCPGDVLTDMCDDATEEGEALSPMQAARDVVWTAQNPNACPGGHFYRAREQIPW